MNKFLFSLAFISSFFCLQAKAEEIRPYIGLDIVYNNLTLNEKELGDTSFFEDDLASFKINGGLRFNDILATEIFFQHSSEEKKNSGPIHTKASFDAFGLDVKGYLPKQNDKLRLFGSFGFGVYNFKGKEEISILSYSAEADKTNFALRFGLGAEYNLDEKLSLVTAFNYVNVTKSTALVEQMSEFSVGIKYSF